MDDWRSRLTDQLLGPTGRLDPTRPDPAGSLGALDVVLGHARSEVTYVLELGRAHNLPVTGSVNGDDVTLRLGAISLRFHLSRRAGVIVASVVGREDLQLRYSAEKRAVVTPDGEPVDATRFVRDAIDATVNAWKASVPIAVVKSERPPLPTLPDTSEILRKP